MFAHHSGSITRYILCRVLGEMTGKEEMHGQTELHEKSWLKIPVAS